MSKARHIVLIGLMGSGKTTVARALRRKTRWPMLDTDQQIEEKTGKSVAEVFAELGEAHFRDLETELLTELFQLLAKPVIFSTGGGIVIRAQNRKLLRQLGFVVWLHVSPEAAVKRLAFDTRRPLLQGEDRQQKLEILLQEREPFYRQTAELIVAGANRTIPEIASYIWREYCRKYPQKR